MNFKYELLSAEEARKITKLNSNDQCSVIVRSIMERITNSAYTGCYAITTYWSNKSKEDIDEVVRRLRELGYFVELGTQEVLYSDAEKLKSKVTYMISISWKQGEIMENNKDLKLIATERWCSISNAIAKKFKTMIEADKENDACVLLDGIKKDLELICFKEEDFENWKNID